MVVYGELELEGEDQAWIPVWAGSEGPLGSDRSNFVSRYGFIVLPALGHEPVMADLIQVEGAEQSVLLNHLRYGCRCWWFLLGFVDKLGVAGLVGCGCRLLLSIPVCRLSCCDSGVMTSDAYNGPTQRNFGHVPRRCVRRAQDADADRSF